MVSKLIKLLFKKDLAGYGDISVDQSCITHCLLNLQPFRNEQFGHIRNFDSFGRYLDYNCCEKMK